MTGRSLPTPHLLPRARVGGRVLNPAAHTFELTAPYQAEILLFCNCYNPFAETRHIHLFISLFNHKTLTRKNLR